MPSTRRSARIASQDSSPTQPMESPKAAAGSKRKSDPGSSPVAKRGRKNAAPKEQKTIEESMDIDAPKEAKEEKSQQEEPSSEEKVEIPSHSASNGAANPSHQNASEDKPIKSTGENGTESEEEKKEVEQKGPGSSNNTTDTKPQGQPQTEEESTSKSDPASGDKSEAAVDERADAKSEERSEQKSQEQATTNGGSAIEAHARDEEVPSSILEKGIIYFLYRGRVGMDDPSSVTDIARTYIVLRPLPHGAKLGDGPIEAGQGKCRLLALPKKVLPLSGRDKFMTFVENAKTSFAELKSDFLPASDYGTQTAGVQHTPAVTPLAEGVYAVTSTGRESHLAYMLTIPSDLGEVQKDMGLREQGSFVVSVKNPAFAGPANAQLPQGPKFPKEVMDKFHGLRWTPLEPEFLNYENTQFLLIGESSGLDHATEPQDADKKDAKKEDPIEEMEKLEGEDEIRVKHLKGDDAIFADLGISKKEYPQVPSTW